MKHISYILVLCTKLLLFCWVHISINILEHQKANQNGRSRETGNIGYTRRNKQDKNTTQYVVDTILRKKQK